MKFLGYLGGHAVIFGKGQDTPNRKRDCVVVGEHSRPNRPLEELTNLHVKGLSTVLVIVF